MTWHDAETAREEWDTDLSDDSLDELLEIARDQVIAYAPRKTLEALAADDAEVPVNLRLAQLRQAMNIHTAASGSATGQISEGEFTYTVYPLDWHVKNLIRPKRGRPTVG